MIDAKSTQQDHRPTTKKPNEVQRNEGQPMLLFPLEIQLPLDEAERLNRTSRGTGGYQRLRAKINITFDPTPSARVADYETARQIVKYAKSYGAGGFQDRFKFLGAALEKKGVVSEDDSPRLF